MHVHCFLIFSVFKHSYYLQNEHAMRYPAKPRRASLTTEPVFVNSRDRQ